MRKKISKNTILPGVYLLFSIIATACSTDSDTVGIYADGQDPSIDFAVQEIRNSLEERSISLKSVSKEIADLVFIIDEADQSIRPEGFFLARNKGKVSISGVDAPGIMYGGLELAEQIRVYGWDGIKETRQNPYMEKRGTKFNLPLDVRTPSYSDLSDAAQNNIIEIWDFEFWKEYIDQLARYRYNFISLWNLHPFPSMVKVPGYEDIALDNVEKSTGPFKEYYRNIGVGFDSPEIISNRVVVKEITIDEKIDFWKKVMAYGRSRNVGFYFVTWNIFIYGTEGKYGLTDSFDNETTRDYFRKSILEMYRTYPDLLGIGLTTGENMPDLTDEEKEEWAYDTYARAILEAANEMPERDFTLIHRIFGDNAPPTARVFNPVIEQENTQFVFSWKYAKAHVYSATRQPYHDEYIGHLEDAGLKTFWTLRNDDIYFFRWGAPDFVREFILKIPYDVSLGYYYGSDQWIWGREFTSKNPAGQRPLEIVKHWYQWMLWGRLGYNPELANERMAGIIQHRFPEADGQQLFDAWQAASMIYPTTTSFHWGRMDYKWYIEACRSQPKQAGNESGFQDVNAFIYKYPTHQYSGFQSIPDYVEMNQKGGSTDLKSPFDAVRLLHEYSDKALDITVSMEAKGNRELAVTLHDIKTMATMGKYYAWKISGAANMALYRGTKDKKYQQQAVEDLTEALEYWKQFTGLALEQNLNPVWLNRVGYVDWEKTTRWVEQDIEIARKDIPAIDDILLEYKSSKNR